jgi:hypothetical protein
MKKFLLMAAVAAIALVGLSANQCSEQPSPQPLPPEQKAPPPQQPPQQ